eukprot:7140988-Lingulodinium_polyedra.AAC.1
MRPHPSTSLVLSFSGVKLPAHGCAGQRLGPGGLGRVPASGAARAGGEFGPACLIYHRGPLPQLPHVPGVPIVSD